jgi:transposase
MRGGDAVQRSFGLDVHLDFCEVAVCEEGRVSQLGRVASTPEAIREFAAGLTGGDQVVLEASCGAMRIARLLEEGPVARVVVCNAAETRAISHARVKSDRFDAAMLLAAGMLNAVWIPDQETSALRRRVARRAGLVRARTRVKNEVHAVLARCLIGRPPVSDLFGKQGRVWLAEQELPEEEAQTVTSCLRHIDFLDGEIAQLDQRIARQALALPGFHRLLTIPGVDVGTAAAVIGAVATSRAFKVPASSWRISAWTRGFASEAQSLRAMGTSQSAGIRRPARCWSRRPGGRSAPQDPCARSVSACARAAARRSPPSRSRASCWCSAGTCSPRTRTTRSRAHH